MSQSDSILQLLRSRGSFGVTPMEALYECGCFRLAARISDLREQGYDITSEMVTLESGKRVARYVLREARQLEMAL